jgi:predicted kinase
MTLDLDLITQTIHFYFEVCKQDPLWDAMRETVEDSEWHIERNVSAHTDMVFTQYVRTMKNDIHSVVGALAVIFHDVGKPAAEEKIFDYDGNEVRRRYAGHEGVSARLWEDWAVSNFSMLKDYFPFLTPTHIYHVAWLIEKHLPYGIKKAEKRAEIFKTVNMIFDNDPEVYFNCLLSDCVGRISANHSVKLQGTLDWIDQAREDAKEHLYNASEEPEVSDDLADLPSVCYVLIGASGSGKTTFVNMEVPHPHVSHSMDDLRLEWYGDPNVGSDRESQVANYAEAFRKQLEDLEFSQKVVKDFNDKLKTNAPTIVVDNVNGSRKRRRSYIAAARSKGYKVVAVLFPISLQQLLDRQTYRHDKEVPEGAVNRQYHTIASPSLGEFDEIVVSPNNV